jgi:uncharacterized protein DUF1963
MSGLASQCRISHQPDYIPGWLEPNSPAGTLMAGWLCDRPHFQASPSTVFEQKSEIRPFFEDAGLAPFASEIERLCAPALTFVAAPQGEAAAAQLGGTPLMPASLAWPKHPDYRNGVALAKRLGWRGPGIDRSFRAPAPLHFVAAIDLAAVKRAGAPGGKLPGEGRLLFFWDALCGCFIDSAETCRVIFDRSPAASLAPRAVPSDLQALVEGEYIPAAFPEQRLKPLGVWSMPDRFLLQDIGSPDLRDSFEDADWEETWDSVFDDITDTGPRQLASGREVLPHRLGGWPSPEQGDPRFAAVAAARDPLGGTPNDAERAACEAEMHAWTLLLQIDLNDMGGIFAEGTLYFVMREADLKAANFERVHAIYQQT